MHRPAPHKRQGHPFAAGLLGTIYGCGQGVAIDYPRAFAAYKVGAEGGNRGCQHQLGAMYQHGQSVDQDSEQARVWFEKAAAQDHPGAVNALGVIYHDGEGVTPSWRRAREYFKRAIQLGDSHARKNLDALIGELQKVIVSPKVHAFHSLVHSSITARSFSGNCRFSGRVLE